MFTGFAEKIEDGSNGCIAIDQYNLFKVYFTNFIRMSEECPA